MVVVHTGHMEPLSRRIRRRFIAQAAISIALLIGSIIAGMSGTWLWWIVAVCAAGSLTIAAWVLSRHPTSRL